MRLFSNQRSILCPLFVCLLGILLTSCVQDTEIPTLTESSDAAKYGAKVTVHDPVPSSVTLRDVNVSVIDGTLHFQSAKDVVVARQAISHTSYEEYTNWRKTLGFESQYSLYRDFVDSKGLNDESDYKQSEIESADLQDIIYLTKEGIPNLSHTSFGMSRFVNKAGEYYVTNDLNIFIKDYHILVDEGDQVKKRKALLSMETSFEEGIIVEPITSYNTVEDGDESAYKVQRSNLTCPQIQVQNIGTSGLTDEQTAHDGNRRRRHQLRSTFDLGGVTQVFNNATGTIQSVFGMSIDYSNWKKQGSWRHTQPSSQAGYFRDNPSSTTSGGSSIDQVRIDRTVELYFGGVGWTPIFETLNVVPSENSLMPRSFSFDEGNFVLFDNVLVDEDFTPGTASGHRTTISYNNGTASIRWTNRGDNTAHDPIAVEYNCQ